MASDWSKWLRYCNSMLYRYDTSVTSSFVPLHIPSMKPPLRSFGLFWWTINCCKWIFLPFLVSNSIIGLYVTYKLLLDNCFRNQSKYVVSLRSCYHLFVSRRIKGKWISKLSTTEPVKLKLKLSNLNNPAKLTPNWSSTSYPDCIDNRNNYGIFQLLSK